MNHESCSEIIELLLYELFDRTEPEDHSKFVSGVNMLMAKYGESRRLNMSEVMYLDENAQMVDSIQFRWYDDTEL